MPKKGPGPSIKDPDQYEALRDDGMSKEKAARISNSSANEGRSTVARRGGRAEDYDDRSKPTCSGERAKSASRVGRR